MDVRTSPHVDPDEAVHPRSHAARRARSRAAILESAARWISRSGYAHLNLEQVARDAGYTRGALYHQFKDKEDLGLAVAQWVDDMWRAEVGALIDQQADPLDALLAFARGHAVFCRRDVARVAMALRVEFGDSDHPIGREVERIGESGIKRVAKLITAGRRSGSIPPGPSARVLARAFVGAVEGTVIAIAGQKPHDEALAMRAAAGVLGVAPPPEPEIARSPTRRTTTT
jgi:AcrR family transcriptional regulator